MNFCSQNPFLVSPSTMSDEEVFSFFQIPMLDWDALSLDTKMHPLPYSYCKRREVLPFKKEADVFHVATSRPLDLQCAQQLAILLDHPVEFHYSPKEPLLKAIEKTFKPGQNKTQHLIASLSHDKDKGSSYQSVDLLEEDSTQAPAVRLLNSILHEAYQQKASDIHLESTKTGLNIRYRIDGVLQKRHLLDRSYQSALFTRLKILSHLDIAEQRRPQDGRFQLKIGQRDLDIRLSSLPTSFGERLVLRLLDPTKMNLNFQHLGFSESLLSQLLPMIQKKEGLFLVTGPTGSGKTTTLYSILKYIEKTSLNVMTIEDPVEYQIPSISQMNVHPAIGLTFSKGLRHILRQDPDIILIGEIRDFETAQIAIQASLTGHFVLSTLHTNDSASSIARLIDMGIEPYLLSAALTGVLAQRLVRTLCRACKTRSKTAGKLKELEGALTFEGKGCPQCFFTGYRGRQGLFELLPMSAEIKKAMGHIKEGVSLSKLARDEGLKTLYHQGIEEIKKGTTSQEEILRVSLPEHLE